MEIIIKIIKKGNSMNSVQSQLLINQSYLDKISKENRAKIYNIFVQNLLFVKADVLTDFINKNYSIKLYGLPNNEILNFLMSFIEKSEFKRTECPFTFEKTDQFTEVFHLRIDDKTSDLYLDFYTY